MAERHVRAVQLHSKLSDRLTRNILEIIALDIGRNDEPARTSFRTIADRSRSSVNTVRDRIEDILKSKELIRATDGKYSLYTINSGLIPYDSADEITREDGGLTNRLVTQDDLIQSEQRLYQQVTQSLDDCIKPLYQLYQQIVSIVSDDQRVTDTEDNKKIIGSNNNGAHIARHEMVPLLIGYFSSLTGITPPHDTAKGYTTGWNNPVVEILSMSKYDLEQAKRRIEHGVVTNRDSGQYEWRTPKSILKTATNWSYGSSVPTSDDLTTWSKVTDALSRQAYNTLTEQEKTAIKAVGFDAIKGRTSFTETKVRAEFFKALQGAKC